MCNHCFCEWRRRLLVLFSLGIYVRKMSYECRFQNKKLTISEA